MNIDSAKQIPITQILEKIGHSPKKKKGNDWWYLSPFRNERTASFHVNTAKNVWYDFGDEIGGDSIFLVCLYLKNERVCHAIPDALRWLDNMFQSNVLIMPQYETEDSSNTIIKDTKPLTHVALIRYMEGRGISQTVAQKYLKEIRIYNKTSQKEFFAAGIKNEEGGYDYRNPHFKGCVHRKTISFVRGTIPKPKGIHFFEGFMDFLSAVMQNGGKKFEDDTIILNSLSCLSHVTGYIKGYGYQNAYTWFDNDAAGKRATFALQKFLDKEGIKHTAMNSSYWPHKDVNESHMAMLNLQGS